MQEEELQEKKKNWTNFPHFFPVPFIAKSFINADGEIMTVSVITFLTLMVCILLMLIINVSDDAFQAALDDLSFIIKNSSTQARAFRSR